MTRLPRSSGGLDAHFRTHDFLFGDRPSLGDYGLIGPLYAHLGRDPWPARNLIAPRVHLKAWIDRMFVPVRSGASFPADDVIADTAMPALRSIFDELVPFVAACATKLCQLPTVYQDAGKALRFFGSVTHPMAEGTLRRSAMSYPVWMAQRLQAVYFSMSPDDQPAVAEWLDDVGGAHVLELDIPHLSRIGLAAAHIGSNFDRRFD